jgi:hypothetical protein
MYINKINLGHLFCYLVFYKINTFEHGNQNLNKFVIFYLSFYKIYIFFKKKKIYDWNLSIYLYIYIYNIFTNKIIIQI